MAAASTVLVTGAAKRVGRAIALSLAESGCDLILHYRSSERELAATVEAATSAARARGYTIQVEAMQADLNDLAAVERLGATIAALCEPAGPRRLAGVVHNASSYGPSEFGAIRAEACLEHFRVNALAPLLLTQALAPALTRAGGAVVFFSDIHALGRPRRRFAPYLMSKAALTDCVATLALELAPRVRVNGIAPGVIAWPDGSEPAEVAAYEARIPLGRSGTPDEAAQLVRWLLFEASYVNGEIIRLDGGRWLR